MTVLSDKTIKLLISKGELAIEANLFDIRGSGVHVHISPSIRRCIKNYGPVDVTLVHPTLWTPAEHNNVIIVESKELVLASSIEWFDIPTNMVGVLWGRSSLARFGFEIHACAGVLEAGWRGQITFELYNKSPNQLRIPAEAEVGQVMLLRMTTESDKPYDDKRKYQNQVGPIPSRMYEEYNGRAERSL